MTRENRVATRLAQGDDTGAEPATDRDTVRSFLEDAAHFPGGHALGVAFPRTERDVSRIVCGARNVLAIGAQSSLTGGATPAGGIVLTTSRLSSIERCGPGLIRVGAGVPLVTLQEELARQRLFYPPVPTFTGACAGGIVATNAAGAATFKYGTTRAWVDALSVVLASGEVLDIQRAQSAAGPDGWMEIDARGGAIRIPIPSYSMPDVAKVSAGYFARPGMDLIDLFIGSEGTLGIITSVTLRVIPAVRRTCWALVFGRSESQALQLVSKLRQFSAATREDRDPMGVDVAGVEYMDRRCLDLLHEDRSDVRCGVAVPGGVNIALLVQLELPAGTSHEEAYAQIGGAVGPEGSDGPLARFCRLLDDLDLLDGAELVLPDDPKRMEALLAFREAVPAAVNQRVAAAKRGEPAIEKTAGDPIVPFDRLGEFLQVCRAAFRDRGLDFAIWGHISDGNVHPNVIPQSLDNVRRGKEAILELGRAAIRAGGCPLAEHGVGRNPVKQALLREMYGEAGIEAMRQVKRALDPEWKLAPGVLFDP